MKRFVPLIQTHGSCADRIALVPGGEPVGGALDYRLYLSFYTGREVVVTQCAALQASVGSAKPPEWVILSRENLERCLTPELRARFTARLRMGSQYLLTTWIRTSPEFDLSPLEHELQAATCPRDPVTF